MWRDYIPASIKSTKVNDMLTRVSDKVRRRDIYYGGTDAAFIEIKPGQTSSIDTDIQDELLKAIMRHDAHGQQEQEGTIVSIVRQDETPREYWKTALWASHLSQYVTGEKEDTRTEEDAKIEEDARTEIEAQINDLLETAGSPSWDRQGAKPVTKELINMALEVIRKFPERIPMPDVSASPMGYVRLDWILEDEFDTTLIMAMLPDSVIHYIYSCDDDDEQFDGRQNWTGKLARGVDCFLQKLC